MKEGNWYQHMQRLSDSTIYYLRASMLHPIGCNNAASQSVFNHKLLDVFFYAVLRRGDAQNRELAFDCMYFCRRGAVL